MTINDNAKVDVDPSNNAVALVGNLSSPVFGRSTGLMGGGQGGIRRLDVKLQFDF